MPHLDILKTYKIYIGGAFPRTESGRYYKALNKQGAVLANMCLSSRKDFRNAVVAARKAFTDWSERAAFNRGQILYRIAEMLEGRKSQFVDELMQQGVSKASAEKEVRLSIDRCVYYSGWCDKFQQLFGSVNPVATSHFNFSVPEPMGVVSILADENSSLLGLLSALLPTIAGGNTCVILASESKPLFSITLAEVLATSDLPGGVVNILTGKSSELHTHFASHMDVNAVVYCRDSDVELKTISELASLNVKRSFHWHQDWLKPEAQNPYYIMDLQEIKTTWHPIEHIGVSGAKY
jgi:acyl-CoA reductase-like NAD-dependent aldehyde dehydrogenase